MTATKPSDRVIVYGPNGLAVGISRADFDLAAAGRGPIALSTAAPTAPDADGECEAAEAVDGYLARLFPDRAAKPTAPAVTPAPAATLDDGEAEAAAAVDGYLARLFPDRAAKAAAAK